MQKGPRSMCQDSESHPKRKSTFGLSPLVLDVNRLDVTQGTRVFNAEFCAGASKPLLIDLFCGLGGWTEGFLAEGWDVIGFDIERHDYGTGGYPAQLVLQDVLTLHGSQFRNADCIVASPPCQAYSYRAMPWKRAKALPPPNNELFDACFRIQREASEAASRHIPMVVENVCGAQRWVGRAKWHYGSFFLWGDVPALMPTTFTIKNAHLNGGSWFAIGSPGQKVTGHNPDSRKVPGFRFDGSGRSFQTASVDGTKVGKIDLSEIGFNVAAREALGDIPKPPGYQRSAEERRQHTGHARKAASAAIAKIPFELASYIARVYKPEICSAATPHGHASRYTESTKPSGKVPERKGRGDLPKIPFKHGPTLQRSLERA